MDPSSTCTYIPNNIVSWQLLTVSKQFSSILPTSYCFDNLFSILPIYSFKYLNYSKLLQNTSASYLLSVSTEYSSILPRYYFQFLHNSLVSFVGTSYSFNKIIQYLTQDIVLVGCVGPGYTLLKRMDYTTLACMLFSKLRVFELLVMP